jgi:hypothetical protein
MVLSWMMGVSIIATPTILDNLFVRDCTQHIPYYHCRTGACEILFFVCCAPSSSSFSHLGYHTIYNYLI